jgi:hypothetical protein
VPISALALVSWSVADLNRDSIDVFDDAFKTCVL